MASVNHEYLAKSAPVQFHPCWLCHGDGWIETVVDRVTGIGDGHRCSQCGGSGRIATEGGEA